MDHPSWLDDMQDGVYGDVEALVGSIADGRELRAWEKAVSCNALDEVKIQQWLWSDSYAERFPENQRAI